MNIIVEAVLTSDVAQIDWDRLTLIFKRAPLGERDPAILRQVFTNSGVRCFAWIDQALIGAGRAITDGVCYAAIFDVVVLPEYQNRGIGKQITTYLISHSGAENVLLHSVQGKEEYYSKLGFRRMKTAMARFKNPELQQERGYIE